VKRVRGLVGGLIGLSLLFALPQIAPYDPAQTHIDRQNCPPNAIHLLGTDLLGRDLLSRVLHGAPITIGRALAATLLAALVGSTIASIGMIGGRLGYGLASAWIEALLAIPSLLLALTLLTLLRGDHPNTAIIMALGAAQVAPFAQVALGGMRDAIAQPYFEAARALGAGRGHLWRNHSLPYARGQMAAYGRVTFAYSLLMGGALGLLGLGGEPGLPEWGAMLAEGRLSLRISPWPALWPGLALTALVWLALASGEANPRI
jgi:peptide/nickel transport system permease protein